VVAVNCAVLLVLMSVLSSCDDPQSKPQGKESAVPKDRVPAAKPARTPAKRQQSGASATTSKTAGASGGSDAVDVRVLTREEMEKRRSSFVVPPGGMPDDRSSLGDVSEWKDLPPWRQATYWGIRARGQFFIYVVDCSGSMIDEDRLPRATIELRRSVFALQPPQKFEVIFYNEDSIPMPGGPIPRSADVQAKNLLRSWLRLIEPDGGTDPRLALRQALSLRPDAVFLLSDGAFPEGTVEAVSKLNADRIPIHCVDLTGGLAGDHLKRIAHASGGRYASRPGDLQGRP
jgi:hypothetical protein